MSFDVTPHWFRRAVCFLIGHKRHPQFAKFRHPAGLVLCIRCGHYGKP
jgi:hypothetical protein